MFSNRSPFKYNVVVHCSNGVIISDHSSCSFRRYCTILVFTVHERHFAIPFVLEAMELVINYCSRTVTNIYIITSKKMDVR